MHFEYTDKVKALQKRLLGFMDEFVYPNEKVFYKQINEGDRWQPTAIIEELPNIESYVKQAASTIKLIGEENHSLKTQVMSTHLAGGLEQGQ